jgi:hypothetical protein
MVHYAFTLTRQAAGAHSSGSREAFKQLMVDRIDGINYTNFKNSVKNEDLHNLYLGFWQDHRRYQEMDRKQNRRNHFVWGPNDFVLVTPPKEK